MDGRAEEVALVGKDVGVVGDVEFRESSVEFVRVADGDVGILRAVKDERRREGGRGPVGVGFGKSAGEFDDGADFGSGVGGE